MLSTWVAFYGQENVKNPATGQFDHQMGSWVMMGLRVGVGYLVAVGTAALKDPRVPERLVRGLAKWCDRHGVGSLTEIVGSVRL